MCDVSRTSNWTLYTGITHCHPLLITRCLTLRGPRRSAVKRKKKVMPGVSETLPAHHQVAHQTRVYAAQPLESCPTIAFNMPTSYVISVPEPYDYVAFESPLVLQKCYSLEKQVPNIPCFQTPTPLRQLPTRNLCVQDCRGHLTL